MGMTDIVQGGGILISGFGLKMLIDFAKSYFAARNQKTEVANDLLRVDKQDKYITRGEFNRVVDRNEKDHERIEREAEAIHENLYARLCGVERASSETAGLLRAIHADLVMIKERLIR